MNFIEENLIKNNNVISKYEINPVYFNSAKSFILQKKLFLCYSYNKNWMKILKMAPIFKLKKSFLVSLMISLINCHGRYALLIYHFEF